MQGFWCLLILAKLASAAVVVDHADNSVVRRESIVNVHGESLEPNSKKLTRRTPSKEEPVAHAKVKTGAHQTHANVHKLLLTDVTNKDNFYKAFTISFLVKFKKDVFSTGVCSLTNPTQGCAVHQHEMLLKTNNDAIEIEAIGEHYGANHMKIVASMKTESGKQGVKGSGKSKCAAATCAATEVPVEDPSQDGKLYSQMLNDLGTDWFTVTLQKTDGPEAKLSLTVAKNGEASAPMESEIEEVQGFQVNGVDTNGLPQRDFDCQSTPAVVEFLAGAAIATAADDIGLQGEIKDLKVTVP